MELPVDLDLMRPAPMEAAAVLDQRTRQRLRIRRHLIAAASSLMVVGILFAMHVQGMLSQTAFMAATMTVLIAVLLFYGAFRTSFNRRFADPSLTVPQMVSATVVVLCTMYWSEGARGVFLIFVLMTFLFGVLRLSTRTLMLYAGFVLAAYGAVIGALWAFRERTVDLSLEILQWFALAVTLPWFARMGGYISALQEGLRKTNAELAISLDAAHETETQLKAAHHAAASAHNSVTDALESLSEAFAVFDAGDRLLLCNRQYAAMYTDDDAASLAGMTFESLVRRAVHRGELVDARFGTDVEGWVAERVRRHREASGLPHDVQMADGRWIQTVGRRTRSGGWVEVRRDITERREFEARQTLEHAVIRLLAEAESVEEILPRIIETFCRQLHWDCGARWRWDEKQHQLVCAEAWGVDIPEIAQYLAQSTEIRLVPESPDWVRRVWTRHRAMWVDDIAGTAELPRGLIAEAAGLQTVLAFPITRDQRAVGVMEFYSRAPRPAEPALLTVSEALGLQIGQFLARKESELQIRQLAHYDPLTELPNRNLFNRSLTVALARARRHKTVAAVLLIDLDGFKQINDTFGHDAGDHLLHTFAKRLANCLRITDAILRPRPGELAARLGGDEFVVVLEDLENPQDLTRIVERVLAAAAEPFDLAGPKGHVTASVGVSLYPFDGNEITTLLKAADTAMYQAKQDGKNKFRYFSTESPFHQRPRVASVYTPPPLPPAATPAPQARPATPSRTQETA